MIGGNVTAVLQKRTSSKNKIGESVVEWTNVCKIKGFIDLSTGDSKRTIYNAKITESTHVFICDYNELGVGEENARMVINSRVYDVLLIDDPMELHEQLEIFLKYTGGSTNVS